MKEINVIISKINGEDEKERVRKDAIKRFGDELGQKIYDLMDAHMKCISEIKELLNNGIQHLPHRLVNEYNKTVENIEQLQKEIDSKTEPEKKTDKKSKLLDISEVLTKCSNKENGCNECPYHEDAGCIQRLLADAAKAVKEALDGDE